MALTGFRLVLLISIFVSTAFYVTARQTLLRSERALGVTASTATAVAEPFLTTIELLPAAVEPQRQSVPAAAPEHADEEAAGKLEPVRVDAVRQPETDMPLDRRTDDAQDAAGLSQGLDGDHVVAVAVNEEDRRARDDLAGQMLRPGKKAGKADNARHRLCTAKTHMQRHHRALAKADKRKRIVSKAKARKLLVEKSIKGRRRVIHTAPALAHVAKRQLKPLPPVGGVSCAGLGCMWGDESGVGE
jgi:hypothetical protein